MAPDRQALMQHHFKPLYAIPKASFLYPIKGLWYFVTHPFLYPLLRARLLPAVLLSVFVLFILFFFTYLPQVAFLAIFHRQGAWVNGTFLVLGEGAVVVALLFEAFFVDETQVDIFDAVLVEKGYGALVSSRRPVNEEGDNPVKRLGKPTRSSIYAPFSLRQIVELVLLLPLNFIPVVGVPLFLVLTGYRGGPFHHWRYFKLHDWTKSRRQEWVRKRKWSYTWFGTVALVLQLVPVLSMFFLMTTAAGAALWAIELEERRLLLEDVPTTGPEFSDDPA
ncbi:hypothetical protein EJ05DRAFT_165535 [Pseudovirgaria hyperparasitica]|uniref:EI24-domain-containing protein n=1 Tax=Pseudovirgaria hyperparasitica TaxID=470096 RepID=A0A6A6VTR4_9PEZI|nr:uncharacterized protein EJ05DRAFT_165535 [Pseudovirgaria hyperparasitica]KAF2753603.1 hypothetical protein EJ05DRAFT_165535 [Pseudovirgaria hyperparasitica]